MYLIVMARKGISSTQLAKEIGITQKSAWFVLRRLREACGDDLTVLRGIVETDETYVGGKEKISTLRSAMTKISAVAGRRLFLASRNAVGA